MIEIALNKNQNNNLKILYSYFFYDSIFYNKNWKHILNKLKALSNNYLLLVY